MPAAHPTAHLFWTLALAAVSAGLMAAVRNRLIRRRLLVATIVLAAAMSLHAAIVWLPDNAFLQTQGWKIEALLAAFAVISAFVSLLFNPWSEDRASERTPAIVQDAVVAVLLVVASVFAFRVSSLDFLAGSAIVAAIVGFALQETLGNAFAGIAIQIDKPFRVGHWIAVGSFEGAVAEVTWRATKIRTKAGNLVIVPNNIIAREPINNYSQPTAPTRLQVEVGATYDVAPNDVRAGLLAAVAQARSVRTSPAPEVLVLDFAGSAITYRVRFWIDDFSRDDEARGEVRTLIYYELRRRKIEIPWPIQIEYSREEPPADPPERRQRFKQAIAAMPVFAALPEDGHHALATAASELVFADGEVIVREGEAGASMFLVCRGKVAVTIGPERREVAVTEAGGYFGEMSLLTGEARTATVVARGDCTVLEIGAEAFGAYVKSRPDVIDVLAEAALARRRALDQSRAAASPAHALPMATLTQRMRQFFGLGA
ncbi:MAG TPA: mechanosensitive ion channel family protein [Vicinamibacterales bacterium]|nr:mechanosensitive ion channel family protein [Vicinamibacterales bacterium]